MQITFRWSSHCIKTSWGISIRSRWEYYCDGGRYCLNAFPFLHGISKTRFYGIHKHYESNGLTTREHDNKGNLPLKTLSSDSVMYFTKFMENYVADHANAKLLPLGGKETHD